MITDLRALARALGGEVSNGQVLAPGPGHSPKDRSLCVKLDSAAPDGFVTNSFAGDDAIVCRDHVRSKTGLPAFKPNGKRHRASNDRIERALMAAVAKQAHSNGKPKGRIVAIYDYKDANGKLLYQVCRYEPKRFEHRQPDGNGGWIYKGSDRRVIYRWPELIAYPDATVFVCEGEKDTDNVRALDLTATTVASGKWTQDCIDALTGRDCWIIQDVDINGAGDKKARNTANHLHGVAKSIKIVRLPGLTGDPGNKDVSDWLEQGHSKDKLIEICASTPDWAPDDASASDSDKAEVGTADEDSDAKQQAKPLIQSSRQFVARYTPPDYLVHGLLLEAFLYCLTGATGAGKTAITLRLAASVALVISFAGRKTKKRRVLYLAAENPVDIRMRWIALAQQMDFDADTIEVYFIEGVFRISKMTNTLKAEAERIGGEFGLIIVDTGPVFYEGDDENNRNQQGKHAEMLRSLINAIPGKPSVLANVHPVKNAAPNNLLPAGGGNFLNQVDGNLTAAKTDSTTEMHWQGKFRGVEFAPIHFLLRTVTHQTLKDSEGGLIPTVVCDWISDAAKEEIAKQRLSDEDQLLAAIAADPNASLAALAIKMGWKLHSGEPNKVKVKRAIDSMKQSKLIKETRAGKYRLTDNGEKALKGDQQ